MIDIKNRNNSKPVEGNDELTFQRSASSGDMTGLIPSGIEDNEIDSYEDIYPYLPGSYKDVII